MAVLKNGKLELSLGGQFDGQIHSVEWFTPEGKWKRIWDTIYPYNDAEILDDTLDCGGFQFWNTESAYPDEELKQLKQLTPIRILWDSEDEYQTEDHSTEFDKDLEFQLSGKAPIKNPIWRYRVVDEICFHQTGRIYKFTVKTLEPTKLLELETCDTMTFTNKLERVLGLNERTRVEYDAGGAIFLDSTLIPKTSVALNQKITIPSIKEVFDISKTRFSSYWEDSLFLETPSYTVKIVSDKKTFSQTISNKESKRISYSLSDAGLYEIEIIGKYIYSNSSGVYYADIYAKWYLNVCYNQPGKPYLTISDCLSRIVNFGKTRRAYDDPTFKISPEVIEKYNTIRAPEFHITRATMWEALKTVAGHVHCIPRLIWNEETNRYDTVIFDELGGTEQCVLKARFKNDTVARDLNKTLDSYCGQIESYVDNLVNTRNNDQGAIVVPYAGGWISARAADGQLEVKDDTVAFRVPKPGYRINKLEIKYGKEADITPCLYEAAEYDTLSNFDGLYPNSTAYALRFKQGDNVITELAHCADNEIPEGSINKLYKIEAIRKIAELFGIIIPPGRFKDIEYRITYLPISSARIIQKKPYKGELTPYTRFYNVAGNTIESDYLGENLKGAIARIGNDTELRTYMFDHCKDIPKPGQILDGMYITKVITEISSRIFIRATLWLTKNFNQKNEYVALDSNLRYYDVSEKQSVDRHINYGDDVLIGDVLGVNETFISMSTERSVNIFKKVFTGDAVNEQISWAYFHGYTKEYNGYTPDEPKKILLPCLSQAMGNSLIFNFACKDNYGADYQIGGKVYGTNGKDEDNKDITKYRTTQTLVPYGNVFGEFNDMDVMFGNGAGIQSYDKLAQDLPEWKSKNLPIWLLSSKYKISKDSRECINFTYQMHFVANRESIVIGSALGQFNPLVTFNKGRVAKCYLLDEPLNKFADYIDVTDLTEVISMPSKTSVYNVFYLPSVINESGSAKRGIAWVIEDAGEKGVVDKKHARLIIGENLDIPANANTKPINFSFGINENDVAHPA